MRLHLRIVTTIVGLIAGGGSLQANLMTNSSFETPGTSVGGFTNYLSGSTGITGWTVVGPEVSVISGSYVSAGFTFPAEDGSQWLDLTGFLSNRAEGVEQSASTTPGMQYTLSFWVGNVFNQGGGYGTTSTVRVLVDGSSLGSFTNSSMTAGTQTWQQFSTTFTATGATSLLEFLNEDPSNDNTNGLDNVVLVASGTPSSVPEPVTYALIAIGVVGLGLIRRRKSH